MSIAAIAEALGGARERGVGAVLAHLVGVEGSHYRRPGARMLLTEDARTAGALSGGCLEGDLQERVPSVLASGAAAAIEYDLRAPADLVWGLGLGCDGAVRILMEPVIDAVAEHLLELDRAGRQRRLVRVATVRASGPGAPLAARLFTVDGEECTRANGDLDVSAERELRAALRLSMAPRIVSLARGGEALLETLRPPLRLLLCGAGPDAAPVARVARALGWSVEIVSPRVAAASAVAHETGASARGLDALASPDPWTAAVLMSHSFTRDAEALHALAASPPPYVGVLGPRARTERLLSGLDADARGALRPVLRAPIGLDLGGESPEEIALAILAEAQAALFGCDARPLSGHEGPLHERADASASVRLACDAA